MDQYINLYGQKFIHIYESDNCFRGSVNETCCGSFEYIIEGSKTIYSPTSKLELNPKESYLKKSGGYVSCSTSGDYKKFKCITFFLYPEIISKAFINKNDNFETSNNNSDNKSVHKFNKNILIDGFINSILSFVSNSDAITDAILQLKLQELLLILSDSGRNTVVNSFLCNIVSAEDITFKKVIGANMYNKLSIHEFAILTNRSESTFKRDFKKIFNDSPANWLKKKRLEKAASLLLTKSAVISEVAWESGFETLAHFSKSFQHHFGVSPSQYKADLN